MIGSQFWWIPIITGEETRSCLGQLGQCVGVCSECALCTQTSAAHGHIYATCGQKCLPCLLSHICMEVENSMLDELDCVYWPAVFHPRGGPGCILPRAQIYLKLALIGPDKNRLSPTQEAHGDSYCIYDMWPDSYYSIIKNCILSHLNLYFTAFK